MANVTFGHIGLPITFVTGRHHNHITLSIDNLATAATLLTTVVELDIASSSTVLALALSRILDFFLAT
jgi:hypothetical protein